jgi:hypothetical protein
MGQAIETKYLGPTTGRRASSCSRRFKTVATHAARSEEIMKHHIKKQKKP